MTDRARFLWHWLGAVATPLAVFSAYLIFSRLPSQHVSPDWDFAGAAASALAGAPFVATLPAEPRHRVAWTCLYVPVAGGLLFVYAFWLLAAVFGEGL